MKPRPKRILSLLLAFMLCWSLFPANVLAAGSVSRDHAKDPDGFVRDAYCFTQTPENTVSIDPDTMSWHLAWSTNFVPVLVEVVKEDDVVVYSTDTDLSESMSCDIPFSKGSGTVRIRAYITMTPNCIDSNHILLDASGLSSAYRFLSSPMDNVIDPDTLKCHAAWTTSFVPERVNLVKVEGETEREITLSVSEPAATMGYDLPVINGPGEYYLKAYFYKENAAEGYAPSAHFQISDSALQFTAQPQSGAYDPDTLKYQLSWTTSFVPVMVGFVRITDVGESEVTLGIPNKDKNVTFNIGAGFGPGRYCLKAYYYRSGGTEHYVRSADFEITDSALCFTVQPQSGSFDPDTLKFPVSWSTSFVPKRVSLALVTDHGESELIVLGLPEQSTAQDYALPSTYGPGDYCLKAYYATTASGMQSVSSAPFHIDDSSLCFTQQPEDGVYDSDGKYTVSWATTFVPERVDLLKIGGGIDLMLGLPERDKAMSYDINLSTYGEGEFCLKLYYNTSNTSAAGGQWIMSEPFSIGEYTPRFRIQPQSGQIDPETLTYTVSWKTNFTPLMLYIFEYDPENEAIAYSPTYVLDGHLTEYELPWDQLYEYNTYVIVAKYGNADYEKIQSLPFTVGFNSLRFVTFPESGILDPDTLTHTVHWQTTFVPYQVELCHYADNNTIVVDDMLFLNLTPACSYDIPVEKLVSANNHFLRVYYGNASNNNSINSPPFSVDFSPLAFTVQPRGGAYVSNGFTSRHTITCETNFTPDKLEICRLGSDGVSVLDTDYNFDRARAFEHDMSGDWGNGVFFLRAWYTDGCYISSALFTVNDGQHAFLDQPAGGSIDLGSLNYTAHWETNFLPDRVELLYYTGDGGTPEPETLWSQQAALNTAMDHTIEAGDAPCVYYVRAWYGDDCIISDPFAVTVDNLEFLEAPYVYDHDPATGEYILFWKTSFVPRRIRVTHTVGDSLLNPVTDEELDSGYDTTGAYVVVPPDGDDTYHFYAFYGSGSQDFVMKYIRLNPDAFRYVVSPGDGYYNTVTAAYSFGWTTNFTPVKVEILRDGEVIDTITGTTAKPMNRTMFYDLKAIYGEGTFCLRAYWSETSDRYFESYPFTVLYPCPMFTRHAAEGSASAENPFLNSWSTSFTPLRLELWFDGDDGAQKLGELNAAATAFAFTVDMARQHQGETFFLKAWYGEGEDDWIAGNRFRVLPRLELVGGTSLDALARSYLFPANEDQTAEDWYAFYQAYLNNATGDRDFAYVVNLPRSTGWARVDLEVWDEYNTAALYYYLDIDGNNGSTVDVEGLPENLMSFYPGSRQVLVSIPLSELRQCFAAYAAAHTLDNPQIFTIRMQISTDRGGYSYYGSELIFRDCHLPVEDYWPSIDYDTFTLTTPLAPELEFPEEAPGIDSVRNEWYAVIATCGLQLEPGVEEPFPTQPAHPELVDEEDAIWNYYFNSEQYDASLDEWVTVPLPVRFYRYFGEGYNNWAYGPENPAPYGPDHFVAGIAANKLVRESDSLENTAVSLSDFINADNRTYLNSLPGLSGESWLGYYQDYEEIPEEYEETWYELRVSIDGCVTFTFADGVVYKTTLTVAGGMDGSGGFHVNGEPYAPITLDVNTDDGSGSSVGEIIVQHEGDILVGDELTLIAPEVEGYAFLGWYDGDTLVSTDLTYTFTVTEEIVSLTACYSLLGGSSDEVEVWFVYKPNTTANQAPADVFFYAFGDGEPNAPWPGTELTGDAKTVVLCDGETDHPSFCYAYRVTVDPDQFHHIIFSDGNGSQTADLDYAADAIEAGGALYRIYYADSFTVLHDGGDVWPESSVYAVEPTCTAEGSNTYYGLLTQQPRVLTVSALGHDFGEWQVDHAPTCTDGGVNFRICSRCNVMEQQQVDPLGHIEGEPTVENNVEPTCLNEGGYDTVVRCTRCGEILSSTHTTVEALGHDWGEWLVDHAPTCEDMGVEYHVCSRCQLMEQRDVEPLGHDWVVGEYVWGEDNAACTGNAVCSRDSGHTLTETVETTYSVVTEPTTSAPGLGRYTAVFENEAFTTQTKDVEIPQLEHVNVTVYLVDETDSENLYCYAWGQSLNNGWPGMLLEQTGTDMHGHPYYVFDVDVSDYGTGVIFDRGNGQPQSGNLTLPAEGYAIFYIYGQSNNDLQVSTEGTDVWPAPGVVTEPTCTEAGYTTYTGILTGETRTGNEVPATGHDWTIGYEWNETEDGWTCTATAVCANDETHVLTETVTAAYAVTQEPTDTDEGVGTYTAVFENELFTTQEKTVSIPAAGEPEPQYNGSLQLYYSFSLGKEITPVYTITNASVSDYVDFWVLVEKAGADPVEIHKADMTGTSAFKASYTGIAAKEMGVNFTATLYAKDASGNIFYGPSVTKTIRNELVTRLKNTSNLDKTRKLCADMLNYGAAAQVYFGYDTDNLVNADVEYIHDYETTGVPEAVNHQATEGTGGMLYTSASLSNRVVLNLKGAMTGGASVKLNVMDEEGTVLMTIDADPISANLFQVNFDQVGAKDMRTIYKFQFVDEGGVSADSRILTWSVESFVAQKLASNEPGSATYEMARTLLIYGDSAKEYLTQGTN